jgi:hypothetical protein
VEIGSEITGHELSHGQTYYVVVILVGCGISHEDLFADFLLRKDRLSFRAHCVLSVVEIMVLECAWGEEGHAYRILVGEPEGKRPLGRPVHRWENNINMHPK